MLLLFSQLHLAKHTPLCQRKHHRFKHRIAPWAFGLQVDLRGHCLRHLQNKSYFATWLLGYLAARFFAAGAGLPAARFLGAGFGVAADFAFAFGLAEADGGFFFSAAHAILGRGWGAIKRGKFVGVPKSESLSQKEKRSPCWRVCLRVQVRGPGLHRESSPIASIALSYKFGRKLLVESFFQGEASLSLDRTTASRTSETSIQ